MNQLYFASILLLSICSSARCDVFFDIQGNEDEYGSEITFLSRSQYAPNVTWFSLEPLNISQGFISTFQFEVLPLDWQGATDGFAFVVQSDTYTGVGSNGGDIGYNIFPNSVEVEFDYYENQDYYDPNGNHIALQYGGIANHSTNNLAMNSSLNFNISDSGSHSCQIAYFPSENHLFIVTVDGNLVLSANVDILFQLGNQSGWIGFAGATGEFATTVIFSNWTIALDPVFCGAGSVCLGVDRSGNTVLTDSSTTVNGNLIINGGTLVLQDSSIVANQGGLLVSGSSTLQLIVSGDYVTNLTAQNTSIIDVDETAQIGGALSINFTLPQSYKSGSISVPIISSTGDIAGQFSQVTVNLNSLPDKCLSYTSKTVYTDTSLSLLVTSLNSCGKSTPFPDWEIGVISACVTLGVLAAAATVILLRKRRTRRLNTRTLSAPQI